MSIDNRFSINFGWKVDPDGRENRLPGKVETRKVTEEEMKKYSITLKGEDDDMKKI